MTFRFQVSCVAIFPVIAAVTFVVPGPPGSGVFPEQTRPETPAHGLLLIVLAGLRFFLLGAVRLLGLVGVGVVVVLCNVAIYLKPVLSVMKVAKEVIGL